MALFPSWTVAMCLAKPENLHVKLLSQISHLNDYLFPSWTVAM